MARRHVPAMMVAESGSDVQVPNPEYLRWVQTDQLLISGLLSTLTIEVLGSVTMLKSSSEVWSTLTTMFSAALMSKVLQLRVQLSKLSKGELSAPAYFQKVKALTDTMSAIGKALDDEEIIAYLLSGLDEEYDSLVDSIAARTDSPSLSEVYSLFIGRDTWVQMRSSAVQLNLDASTNFSSCGGRGGGRGYRGRGGHNSFNGGGQVDKVEVAAVMLVVTVEAKAVEVVAEVTTITTTIVAVAMATILAMVVVVHCVKSVAERGTLP